jgi:hypothetical protein
MFTAVSLRTLKQYGKMHSYEIRYRHQNHAGPDGGISMRRTSWLWLFLLIMCLLKVSTALGETASYSFYEEGLRLYLPGDWQVLTLSNLKDHEQEIKALGTTAEALAASFTDTGMLLEAFPAEGGQIKVQLQPLPEEFTAQDAYSMTTEQKEDFLLKMAGSGGFLSGAWSEELPEFAVFRSNASMQSLSVQTITYATVRYGQVFTVSAEIIGREPTKADEDDLNAAAASMLFLGTQGTPVPLVTPAPQATLNIQPTSTPVPAEVKVQRDETKITLDYVPSVVKATKMTVTGVTAPDTPLRYYVNGQGYERFTSDSEGRFTCPIRELTKNGKNVVTIYAIGEKGYGVVAFTVMLEQEKAPLTITPMTQGVAGNSTVITGAVLPGSEVQVLYHTKTYDAVVHEDGSFICEVGLDKLGENTFTVRATLTGYLKGEEKLTAVRIKSDLDEQEAFQKKLRRISYGKLTAKPEAYKDSPVKYEGLILSLSGQGGQPLAVISTEGSANPVAVLCTDLYGLELNQQTVMLCTLTGAMREVTLPSGKVSIPEARLNWLLPNE